MMQMNLPMRLRLRNTEQTCGFQSGGQVGGMVPSQMALCLNTVKMIMIPGNYSLEFQASWE